MYLHCTTEAFSTTCAVFLFTTQCTSVSEFVITFEAWAKLAWEYILSQLTKS